jgi:peroxiredoxin Q/BCP
LEKLKIGQVAPLFKLKNENDELVSLANFKGNKVLIYFYPKAMTPGCTTQAQCLRDEKKIFEKLNIVILGISPDKPLHLKKFIEKEELNFTLLSDPDHAVAEKYGVWGLKKFMGREFMGVIRTSFIVDEKGKIEFILDKVKTKSHHQDVLNLIK